MLSQRIAILAFLIVPSVCNAQIVQDQFSPAVPSEGDFGLHSQYVAQTFVPGVTGALDHITLTLEDAQSGNIIVDLVPTIAGMPGNTPIATATYVPPVPNGGIFPIDFDFSLSSPLLIAGTQYAWVIRGTGSSTNTYGANRPSDPYAFGQAWISQDAGLSYQPHFNASDFAFTTWMNPIPEPTSFALVCLGLVAVACRQRRRGLRN